MLQEKDWIIGSQYTVVDPYALVFYGWGLHRGFPMNELAPTRHAGAHDEPSEGEGNCRERAERFNFVASLRSDLARH